MAKVIFRGLAPRDHPLFNGGVQTFTVRRPEKPKEPTPEDTLAELEGPGPEDMANLPDDLREDT